MDALDMDLGDTTSVLRYYLALENASHEMLKAARAGDWDSVCRLEGACAIVIAKLRQLAPKRPLEGEHQQERMRILRAILSNDAQIRRISDPLPHLLDPRSFSAPDVSLALH